mgnify:CR=1 FL=1
MYSHLFFRGVIDLVYHQIYKPMNNFLEIKTLKSKGSKELNKVLGPIVQ